MDVLILFLHKNFVKTLDKWFQEDYYISKDESKALFVPLGLMIRKRFACEFFYYEGWDGYAE